VAGLVCQLGTAFAARTEHGRVLLLMAPFPVIVWGVDELLRWRLCERWG
jgi:hypothetical protein